MALAETAQLVVDLRLNDQLSGGVTRAESQLAGLNRTAGSSVGATGMLGGAMSKLGLAAEGVGGAMSHAGNQLKGLISGPLGMVGLTGGVIGLAAGMKGAVESATSFQSSMELIATQAGGTAAEVEAMTKGVMAMATSVGTSPEALAAGLYHIESAGVRGAKALDLLRIAAEGAKVGNTDLEGVTNALVGAVNSGISGAQDFGQAMGTLNAIVGAGNMRMEDLVAAFATGILPTARAAGVSFTSVGAALADMTRNGVPAEDAATRLRMSLSLLAAPTAQAGKVLAAIGIDQLTLANKMRGPGGIADAIALLAGNMRKAGLIGPTGEVNSAGFDMLSKAFGGGRSSSAIISLVNDVGKLGDIQRQVTDGASGFGDAWTKTTQEAEFSFAKFQAAIGTLAIRLGNALLPPLSAAAEAASTWLGDPANQQSLVGGLDAAMGLAKDFGTAISDFVIPPLKVLGDIVGAIPGPIKEALVAGFAFNKAFGWLFGVSPLKIGTNLLGGLLGSTAGRIPGVGGAVSGALGVPHVWVDNMPLGGIGGGGGIPGAAGGAMPFLASGLGAAAGLAVAAVATVAIAQWINSNARPAEPAVTAAMGQGGGGGGGGFGGAARAAMAARGVVAATDPAVTHHLAVIEANTDNLGQQSDHMRSIAATQRNIAAQTDRQRSLIATQTAAAVASRAGIDRTATAAQQFRDRLARLNADENRNSDHMRSILATQKPPLVQTTVNVNTNVSVTDIAGNTHRVSMHGGMGVWAGNRLSGSGHI